MRGERVRKVVLRFYAGHGSRFFSGGVAPAAPQDAGSLGCRALLEEVVVGRGRETVADDVESHGSEWDHADASESFAVGDAPLAECEVELV